MRSLPLAVVAALGLVALAGACSDDSNSGTGGAGAGGAGGQGAGGNGACGDGLVDTALGETCDPCGPIDCYASPGSCMTSMIVGSAATCDLGCEETPITACVADGCCADGCTDDPDCSCDASNDCNACFDCAGNGPCDAAVSGCEASPECIAYVNCTGACSDGACVQTCQQASTPAAIALFEAWFSCVLCDTCVVSCMGSTNIAFPGCP